MLLEVTPVERGCLRMLRISTPLHPHVLDLEVLSFIAFRLLLVGDKRRELDS